MTQPAHMDLLDCVIDLMAVDILTAVLQHFDGLAAFLFSPPLHFPLPVQSSSLISLLSSSPVLL